MDIVPLQEKYCKECMTIKIRLDFSSKSAICKECQREKNRKQRPRDIGATMWTHNYRTKVKRDVDLL